MKTKKISNAWDLAPWKYCKTVDKLKTKQIIYRRS